MAIKNNKSIDISALRSQLKKDFPDYEFKINGNAVTVSNDKVKLNVVSMGEGQEFWIVEAVPFNFKMMMLIFILSFFVYWVQQQDWHWGVNIALYLGAFVGLGYLIDFLYAQMYRHAYKDFKPAIIGKVKELVE